MFPLNAKPLISHAKGTIPPSLFHLSKTEASALSLSLFHANSTNNNIPPKFSILLNNRNCHFLTITLQLTEILHNASEISDANSASSNPKSHMIQNNNTHHFTPYQPTTIHAC
jgi:hypothetical protein